MPFPRRVTWRSGFLRLAIAGLLGACLIFILGFVFAMSGLYNVSATGRHFEITEKLIKIALHRSVSLHSDDSVPVDLKDQNLVRLGARHFDLGCAPCHGAPGKPPGTVMQEMYPEPPGLTRVTDKYTAGELAWIIESGLKMTGMPAWAGRGRKDEVWPLVAFVHQLPEMGPDAYSELAGSVNTTPTDDLSSCVSCHGREDRSPVDPMVPSLSGQSSAYLQRALTEYRSGMRQSGMMEPVAVKLDDAAIRKLANSFSEQPRSPRDAPAGDGNIALGRQLATSGEPQQGIPACLTCHGESASDKFPRLNGLSRTYISRQLSLFKSGVRNETAYGAVMATVARRLTPKQIDAAAAYFASTGARPAAGDGQ